MILTKIYLAGNPCSLTQGESNKRSHDPGHGITRSHIPGHGTTRSHYPGHGIARSWDYKVTLSGSWDCKVIHAPSYLSDNIHLVSEGPRRRLRSSTDRLCVVPRTHNTFGDRSFTVARPHIWNSLPGHLRDENITYNRFTRELKIYWFSCKRGAI